MTAVILLLGLVLATAASAQPQRRVALVIGNGAYQHGGALRNPPNDARRMAEVLRGAGFDVILGIDLTRQGMEARIREFGDRLDGGQLGLFFYAGHGMQVGGENYLLPVDARLQRERDLPFETIPLSQVLRSMESAAPTNLLFLDACRDNPLTRSFASSMGARSAAVGRGLAQVQSGVGTLVSYATAPNSVAEDGVGAANSPFTTALAQHLATPGLEVGLVMRRVREAVLTTTGGRQVPWDHSSLTGEVVLVPVAAVVPAPALPPQPVTPAPPAVAVDREALFWQSAQSGGTRADFEAYLQAYPSGTFAAMARARLSTLSAPPQTASQAIRPPAVQPPAARPEAPVERELTLAGRWSGAYRYSDGRPPVPFTLQLSPSSRGFTGRSSEPNTFGLVSAQNLGANWRATIQNGRRINLWKTYDGSGGQTHSVSYAGQLSEDGQSITGTWRINDFSGSFAIRRIQ